MSETVARTVYFDNAATTPILPVALERLNEVTLKVIGNSSSAHRLGRLAQDTLDRCHESLGRLFDVPPSHVIFTSGGTESNNLGIWGALGGLATAFNWIKSGGQGKLLTSTIEHSATTSVFEALECMGAPVSWLSVDREGFLDMSHLEEELASRVRFLSIHHAHNEIGILQNVAGISKLVRSKQPDAIIHIDAVQSFMKVPLDMAELGVDMVSISGHKFGGPKGIGALVLGRRFETRNPKIGPLIHGSSQQHGMRPGTVPVPAIASMVTAVEWGEKNMATNRSRLLGLRARLASVLPKNAVINGPADVSEGNPNRAPQTLNFSMPKLPSAVVVEALSSRGYCISSGAACHSTNPKPNESLMAMGVGLDRALSSVRASFGPQNTLEEVDAFGRELAAVVEQLS